MPRHEIGPKVMFLGLAAIAAAAIVALVWLGAKDVALYLIDAVTTLQSKEGVT